MSKLFSDITYALRQMRKAPGFTLAAVVTLALGIGANAAIFTLVHAIFLRPFRYESERSVSPWSTRRRLLRNQRFPGRMGPLFLRALPGLRVRPLEFEDLAALRAGIWTIGVRRAGDNGPALPMHDEYVSGNYFSFFGVRPGLGRLLTPSDDQTNAAPAAVMSYRAWQNYFASDPSIVGSSVAIDGFHVTVVGIAPAEFFGDRLTTNPPDFWLPLAIEPAMRGATSFLNSADMHWLYVIGRLKSGVPPAEVQSKVTGRAAAMAESVARARPQSATVTVAKSRSKKF